MRNTSPRNEYPQVNDLPKGNPMASDRSLPSPLIEAARAAAITETYRPAPAADTSIYRPGPSVTATDAHGRPEVDAEGRFRQFRSPGVVNPRPSHDHTRDSQEEQRARRVRGYSTEYDERFVLSTEVAAALGDLPARLAAAYAAEPAAPEVPPTPDEQWRRSVGKVVGIEPQDAEVRLATAQGRWVALISRQAVVIRTALAEVAAAVRIREPLPEVAAVTPDSVATGLWADSLYRCAQVLDRPLSEALGKAETTALSDALITQLRELDRAAREFESAFRQRATDAAARILPPVTGDPMAALRSRHNAEQEELRVRHAAEWATASAEVKAARLAAQAVRS